MFTLDQFAKELPLTCSKTIDIGALGVSCIAKLEQALYQAAGEMAFEYVRYTCWHKDAGSHSTFPMSFSLNFSNFPAAWEKIYEARRYYLHDPVVRAITEAGQSQLSFGTWQQARQDAEAKETAFNLERTHELFAEAARHAVNNGFYMAITTGLSRFVVSLGTSRSADAVEKQVHENLPQRIFSLMALLGQSINLTQDCTSCVKSLRVQGGEALKLTKKQCEVLKTFAEHASASNVDVARINHVTVETVAFHLKAIRKKFNQPNASGHALSNIAMMHGLI